MANTIKPGTSIVAYAISEDREAMRPSWDEYFTNIAREVASRSSCPRASCGSVIVSKDNHILSTGYNGRIQWNHPQDTLISINVINENLIYAIIEL